MSQSQATPDSILTDLVQLITPHSVTEMRILTRGGMCSGYYDDLEALARDAARYSGSVKAVYWTMNPCDPRLLSRAPNHIRDAIGKGEATSDDDILARKFMLVDIDPTRPADVAATSEEQAEARTLASEIQRTLALDFGFPEPVRFDSGNGAYLLYSIDLPNSPASAALVKGCLRAMARYNRPGALVDTSTSNASRIMRVPGTLNCKGTATEERPHRLCTIVHMPGVLECVPRAALERLCVLDPKADAGAARPVAALRSLATLASYTPSDAGEAYSRRALDGEIRELLGAGRGGRNSALNSASYSLGQLVGGGVLNETEVYNELESAASKIGLERGEIKRTIESGMSAGKRDPRGVPEPPYRANGHSQAGSQGRSGTATETVPEGHAAAPTSTQSGPEYTSLVSLAGGKFISVRPEWIPVAMSELPSDDETIPWLWGGYIARGYKTSFTGLWKSGKTTLLKYLLKSMDGGASGFCGLPVTSARVLVVSEETKRLWAGRRDELELGDHVQLIALPFRGRPPLDEWLAFMKCLEELQAANKYDLVVFDSMHNLWGVTDENKNAEVLIYLMPLNWLTEQGAALLLIAHPSKGDAGEGRATRGGGAWGGFVDLILEMRRHDAENRDDTRRVLTAYSRWDDTPGELVIELDKDKGEYQIIGTKGLSENKPVKYSGWNMVE